MNKLIAAIALVTALPAVANAQPPQPAAKAGCCAGMKEKCACCKDMAGRDHSDHGKAAGHAGHDAPQPDGKAAPADPHQNHQR